MFSLFKMCLSNFGLVVLLLCLLSNSAFAQQLSVKSGKLLTFADHVTLIVVPKNTFNKQKRMLVRVYDHNFKLIKAKVSPRDFKLAGGATRNVRVTVPFLGKSKKKFRICAEQFPESGTTQQVRTRVCGRFHAARVQQ